jgi:hypothetical protein
MNVQAELSFTPKLLGDHMHALKRLTVAIIAASISNVSPGAAQAPGISDGELMMAAVQRTIQIRVEYCLRNVSELREELSLAHQTFSMAAARATEILKRRFPGNNRTVHFEDSKMAADFALQQAHTEGFDRLCPRLLTYLQDATGEALAKEYGDPFAAMKK